MSPPVSEPPTGQRLADGVSPESAVEHLKQAAAQVTAQLQDRAAAAAPENRAVLEATALMASDPMLIKSANKLIMAGASAERALWDSADTVAATLKSLGGYMAERATDVLDVRSRIIASLRGEAAPGVPSSSEPFILLATDLAPADTATLDPTLVLALVTAEGGPQSHTAIIARALGLPAIVAANGITALTNGTELFVDGGSGRAISEPGAPEHQLASAWANRNKLEVFAGPGTTSDGHLIPLLANVGTADDAVAAAAAGAEGVGLLRTEFCFLGRESEPSIEEQVEAYRGVFAAFPGKKVVVRTLDAGADKPLPFLTNPSEPNPALGVRGYRTSIHFPSILRRQLDAIAQAAALATADVWVMAPMISTPTEAAEFASLCADAGLKVPGVMVEVPSAAIRASAILSRVSFASLGTNDLTQYTMAADRQLGPLASLNNAWQPAVLQLIAMTVAGAREEAGRGDGASGGASGEASAGGESAGVSASGAPAAGAPAGGAPAAPKAIGVCGEAAADPALAVVLVGLGVNSLSMSPRALAAVGAVLASVSLAEARELAQLALSADSPEEAKELVRSRLPLIAELGL